MAAVLASISVASEQVASIESQGVFRHAIKAKQSNDPWHLDFETYGAHPIVMRLLEGGPKFADFDPGRERVVGVLAFVYVQHFGQISIEQPERAPHVNDVDRAIKAIKNENARSKRSRAVWRLD